MVLANVHFWVDGKHLAVESAWCDRVEDKLVVARPITNVWRFDQLKAPICNTSITIEPVDLLAVRNFG